MKTLYLLRHAKSSWNDSELRDFERPLAKRGLNDAPVMASRLMNRKKFVGCIISSPANRAKATAKIFAEHIGYPIGDIISNPELYFAGVGMFLKSVLSIDDHFESAMLVGHNPSLTEFANMMANTAINNVPTCGLVELSLPIERWTEADTGIATLVDFDYPKNIS